MGLPSEPWGVCFAITRQGSSVFEIGSVSEIPELVTRLRELLVRPSEGAASSELQPGEFIETAQQLHRLLIAPARSLLAGKRRMIVVPDRYLTAVPFEVLLDGAAASPKPGAPRSWASLPYLVRSFSLSYAPSATVYVELQREKQRPAASKDLLAIADPVYEAEGVQAGPLLEMLTSRAAADITRAGFARLPYTAQEAAAVASLFAPARRDVLLRENANEDRFFELIAANNYRYLLFSVHGVASTRYPQFSSLVLTRLPNSSRDGLLQVHEIYNLSLPSDLVVLSACETALGRNIQGEGLVGLVRAFLYAGANSVVASLWRVQDQSTSQLMAAFFREIKQGGRDNAAALEAAKLQMLKKAEYAHPFFWAPFILSGKP